MQTAGAHRSWDWICKIKHKAQKPLRKTAKMCFLQPPLKQRREGPIIKVEITDVKADRSLSIAEDIMRHWKSPE